MTVEPGQHPDRTQLLLHLHIDRRRAFTNADFRALMREFPEIVEGIKLSGDSGYCLRVSICHLGQYETLRERLLEKLPDVRRVTASVVMDRLLALENTCSAS